MTLREDATAGNPVHTAETAGTPRTDRLWLGLQHATEFTRAVKMQSLAIDLERELTEVRDALAGTDISSLPSDFPTVRMAHTIRADHDKFLLQVRDTCVRAEAAEAQRDELQKRIGYTASDKPCESPPAEAEITSPFNACMFKAQCVLTAESVTGLTVQKRDLEAQVKALKAELDAAKRALAELVEEMENNKRGGACDGVYDVCSDLVLKKMRRLATLAAKSTEPK